MRRLALIILALAMLLPSLAQAYDVLVVVSRREPAFEDVLKGFRSNRALTQRLVVLSDYAEADIARITREDRPGLVLALGDAALAATRKIHQTPVMSLMSLGIHGQHGSYPNQTGIGMYVPPERYLTIFQEMKTRRVGVVHSPAKSGWYLRQARQAAQSMGIELVVREVNNPRETIDRLASLSGKVDAIWMLPDTTAVTRETAEAYFQFSQDHKVPVVSFAGAYLGLGAAAVLEIDRAELGRQAVEMVANMLKGNEPGSQSVAWPRKTTLKTNQNVLKNLGITSHFEISATRKTE
jgi:putative tryptophan/tyrosine transport system substrate-binding protein